VAPIGVTSPFASSRSVSLKALLKLLITISLAGP
jgi:hypothetical protein